MIKNKNKMIKLFEDFNSEDSHAHYINDLLSDIYYDGLNYKIWANNIFFNRCDNKFSSFDDDIQTSQVPILIEISMLNDDYDDNISDVDILTDNLLSSIKSVDSYLNSNSYYLVEKNKSIETHSYLCLNDDNRDVYFYNVDFLSKNEGIWFICLAYNKK